MKLIKPAILVLGFSLGAIGARVAAPSDGMLAAAEASTADAGAVDATPTPDPVGAAVERPAADAPQLPPGDSIPDPEQEPSGFLEAFLQVWRNGGKVPTAIVLAIGLVHVLLRRVKWLQVGWRRAGATLTLVVLTTLLDTWISKGAAGNLTMWLLGAVGAVVGYLSRAAPVSLDPERQPVPKEGLGS